MRDRGLPWGLLNGVLGAIEARGKEERKQRRCPAAGRNEESGLRARDGTWKANSDVLWADVTVFESQSRAYLDVHPLMHHKHM